MTAWGRFVFPLICLIGVPLLAGCGRRDRDGAREDAGGAPTGGSVCAVLVLPDCHADLQSVAVGTNGFGAIAGDGVILVTRDFGAKWNFAYGPVEKGPEFTRVDLAGPKTAWTISRSLLLRTTDAGEVWTECGKPGGNFYYYGEGQTVAGRLLLMQPQSYGTRIHTTADGQAWDSLPGALPRNDYEVLWFLDAKMGWVAGNYGRFARTADGGRTWTKHDLKDDPHIAQVQFVDPAHGWIRVQGTAQRLMRTVDGGLTWRQVEALPPPARAARAMQWFSPTVGVVLAEVQSGRTQVLRTDDACKTWTVLGDHTLDLTALHFLNPGRGWAVGRKGAVVCYGRLGS